MNSAIAAAMRNLITANEEAARAFSTALSVTNRVLKDLAAQINDRLPDAPQYMTVEECSEFTRISVAGLYKLTHHHRIPYTKAGRALRFNKQDIIAWLEAGRVKTDVELQEGL